MITPIPSRQISPTNSTRKTKLMINIPLRSNTPLSMINGFLTFGAFFSGSAEKFVFASCWGVGGDGIIVGEFEFGFGDVGFDAEGFGAGDVGGFLVGGGGAVGVVIGIIVIIYISVYIIIFIILFSIISLSIK